MSKYLCLIMLFFSGLNITLAQTDSIKKVWFETEIPFGANRQFFSNVYTTESSINGFFNKANGGSAYIGLINTQLMFLNKLGLVYSAKMIFSYYDAKKAVEYISNATPDYLVQGEGKFVFQVSSSPNAIFLNQLGVCVNLKQKTENYWQPILSYCFGESNNYFPDLNLAFKSKTSNYYFTNTYSFPNETLKGLSVAIGYKHYDKMKNDRKNRNTKSELCLGLKLELCYLWFKSTNQITKTDINSTYTSSINTIKSNLLMINLGLEIGLGTNRRKKK